MLIGMLLLLTQATAPPAPPIEPQQTGGWLSSACEEAVATSGSTCLTYVTGVFDTLQLLQAVCVPSGVSNDHAARVVQKFLRDNPQRLHEHRVALTVEALLQAFQCRPRK
jgi:hypothetical protein